MRSTWRPTTLARDIEDLERGQAPENAYDRQRERSVWRDIPTHRVLGTMVYELPFGKGKPLFPGLAGALDLLEPDSFHTRLCVSCVWFT